MSRRNEPRVALVCAGLGVVNRGFERLAADMYDLLAPDFPVTLVRGGGPRRPGELRLRVPRRNERPLALLGGDRALALELAAFAARLAPSLVAGRFTVVHYLEPYLGNLLFELRRRLGLSFALLLTDGVGMTADGSRRADLVHVVTPEARERVLAGGRASASVEFIPCGIRVERFAPRIGRDEARARLGLPSGPRVLLDIAALNRGHKRIHVLIDEVARVGDDSILLIDGSPEDPGLIAYGKSVLGERFQHRHVPTADVPLLHAAADVFVHVALEEGFGLAAVEAMAAGLPVVMHDQPHFRWLVGDVRQLRDLVQPGAVAGALAALPRDASERNRARAAELDWATLQPRYAALYARVLARDGVGEALAGGSNIVFPR